MGGKVKKECFLTNYAQTVTLQNGEEKKKETHEYMPRQAWVYRGGKGGREKAGSSVFAQRLFL